MEERYYVIKIKDFEDAIARNHLSMFDKANLERIMIEVNRTRQESNKQGLETVVVEKDWPEYEKVVNMLKQRIAGE